MAKITPAQFRDAPRPGHPDVAPAPYLSSQERLRRAQAANAAMYDPATGAFIGTPNTPGYFAPGEAYVPHEMQPEDARRQELSRQFYDPDTGKYVGDPSAMPLAAKLIMAAPLVAAGGFAAAPLFGGGAAAAGGGVPSIAAGGVSSGVPAGALGTATTLGSMASPSLAAGSIGVGTGLGGGIPAGQAAVPSIASGGVSTGVPAGAMGTPISLSAPPALPSISAGGVGAGVPTGAMGTPIDPTVLGGTMGGSSAGFKIAPYLKDKFKDPQTYFDIAGMIGSAIATRKQQQGIQEAIDLQKQIYEQTRADLGPYREIGGRAMTTLGGMMGLGGIGPPVDAAPALGPGSGQRTRSPDAVDTGRKAVRREVPPPGGSRSPENVEKRDPIVDAGSGYGQVMLPSGEVVTVPAGFFADELEAAARRRSA